MRRTTLHLLLALTLVLGAIAAWLITVQIRDNATDLTGKLIFPGLEARLNEVTRVHFETMGTSFDLVRKGKVGWVLPQESNYPVAFNRIKALLTSLATLKAIEPRTRQPHLYHYLGVEDPGPKTPNVHLVVKAGSDTLADLIVGHYDSTLGPNNMSRMFVRVKGDRQSWLGQANLRLNKKPLEWLDHRLVTLSPDRVASVAVKQGGVKIEITRPAPADSFVLAGLDKATDTTRRAEASALGAALSSLTFDKVQTVDHLAPDAKVKAVITYRTFDGLVVTITDHEMAGGDWATISAAFDAQAAAAGAKLPNPPGADGSTLLKDAKAVKAEVQALANKTKGWVYLLTQAKVLEFTPRRSTLIKAKRSPAAAPSAPAQAAPAQSTLDSGSTLPHMDVPADGAPTPSQK